MSLRVATISALLFGAFALGARAQIDDSPIDLPDLRDDAVVVEALSYSRELPQGMVAKVNGDVLTQADLLKQLLVANLETISNTLLMTKMVDLELQRGEMTISDKEIQAELEEMLPRMAPGKTLEELLETGVYSRSYLERVARMNRGWKLLFWKAKNIPEDRRTDQSNQLLMQLFVNEVKGRYQLALRGKEPAPPKGSVAALNTLVRGKRVSYVIDTVEAMEFLVGLLRPATLIQGQNTLIDNHLVRRELEGAAAGVSDTEVEAWVRGQREKYPPPFTWETILRIKGSSPDAERNRWRNVQAWKRANRIEISQADLEGFRQEHEDFFRARHVKVSHILVSMTDTITGLPLSEDARSKAKVKAERIAKLAREGVDFGELAKKFSDDLQTGQAGGKLQQPIKKWGGGYDENFQRVAYSMEKGALSEPIESQFGYHVIRCDEVSPASKRDINWNDARYAEWILEEYETKSMRAWLDGLRQKAEIERASRDDIFKLKLVNFPERNKN